MSGAAARAGQGFGDEILGQVEAFENTRVNAIMIGDRFGLRLEFEMKAKRDLAFTLAYAERPFSLVYVKDKAPSDFVYACDFRFAELGLGYYRRWDSGIFIGSGHSYNLLVYKKAERIYESHGYPSNLSESGDSASIYLDLGYRIPSGENGIKANLHLFGDIWPMYPYDERYFVSFMLLLGANLDIAYSIRL